MGYLATALTSFAAGILFTVAVVRNNRQKAKDAIDKL